MLIAIAVMLGLIGAITGCASLAILIRTGKALDEWNRRFDERRKMSQ